MQTINWKPFFENSSTRDALIEFAQGTLSIKQFHDMCWPKECKAEVSKMNHIGTRASRLRARRALTREGWWPQ